MGCIWRKIGQTLSGNLRMATLARLFTIPTDDSPEQTRRVLKEQTRRAKGEVPTVGLEPWHAL